MGQFNKNKDNIRRRYEWDFHDICHSMGKNLRGVTLKLPTVNLQKPITAVEQIFNEELSGSRKPVCISMKDCPDC